MWRYLIHTENFSIPMFGVMAVIAFLIGFYIVRREAKKEDIPMQKIESLAFWILIGVLIGGRIWYVLEMWSYYRQNVGEIFKFWEGGLVFYGGFIGGFIGALLYLKISKLDFSKTSDIFALALPIVLAIGRIGCFLNGCCFGKETKSFIGVCYPKRWFPPAYISQLDRHLINLGAEKSLPVIPTQLISSFLLLIIFVLIFSLRKKKPYNGFLFHLFLGLYGIKRFSIDFFRHYEGNALIFKVLTLSQILSIILIILSVVLITLNIFKIKKK